MMAKVFQLFFTTKPKAQASATITRQLVDEHKGDIGYERSCGRDGIKGRSPLGMTR